jgi:hypothetical protein
MTRAANSKQPATSHDAYVNSPIVDVRILPPQPMAGEWLEEPLFGHCLIARIRTSLVRLAPLI